MDKIIKTGGIALIIILIIIALLVIYLNRYKWLSCDDIENLSTQNIYDKPPKIEGSYRGTLEHVGEFLGKVYTYENPVVAPFEMVVKQNGFFIGLEWFINRKKMTSKPYPGVIRQISGKWEVYCVSTVDQMTFRANLIFNDNSVCIGLSFIGTEPGPVLYDPTKSANYPSVTNGYAIKTISIPDSKNKLNF